MRLFSQQSFAIKLSILGIFSLLFFLITTIPARLVTNALPEELPINLFNVQGSIWNGHAEELSINGYPIGKLDWSLKILPLLSGKLAANISLDSADLKINGNVGIGFDETVTIKNTQIKSNLDWLTSLAQLPPTVSGTLNTDIDYLTLTASESNPLPNSSIKANVVWENAGTMFPEPFTFGNFTFEVTSNPNNTATLIKIVDGTEPLKARGEVEVLSSGDFSADLALTPSPELPDSISSGLSFIGEKDASGEYKLTQRGHLRDYIGFPK